MLAAAAQLRQVTQLQLNNIYTSRHSSSSNILESMAQAIAGMPDLRCLELSCVTLDAATAARIGTAPAASKLTRLQLRDCELENDMLLSAVRGMSALQHLDVSNNLLLTDAALTGLAGELPQLVELDAVMTNITRAARDSLQATRP
jgi:Leucine-rich repeat (LRR) protein